MFNATFDCILYKKSTSSKSVGHVRFCLAFKNKRLHCEHCPRSACRQTLPSQHLDTSQPGILGCEPWPRQREGVPITIFPDTVFAVTEQLGLPEPESRLEAPL